MIRTVRIATLLAALGLVSIAVAFADIVIPPDTVYRGTLQGSTKVWFAVPVKSDGSLSVTLAPSDGVNMALLLCAPTRDSLLTDDCWGNPLTLSLYGVKPDTFYFSIFGYYQLIATHAYTITTVFAEAALQNDSEPNDSSNDANSLPLSGLVTGHIGYDGRWPSNPADVHDWWKITTVQDGALTVTMSQVEPFNLQLALFRPGGDSLLANADTWGDTTSLGKQNLRNGTYLIRVAAYGWCYSPYTIGTTFVPARGGNDPEPNNSLADASSLTIGAASEGHLGFDGFRPDADLDAVDWWHFTLTDTSELTLTLTQAASANLKLQLYKSDGVTLIHDGNDTWGKGYELKISKAVPGKYYLRVLTYGLFDSYTLTVAATGITGTGDYAGRVTSELPAQFELHQNYPNPFNPVTTIRYAIPRGSFVSLRVYDLLGQEIMTLVNELKPTGRHSVELRADQLASGLYFYRLETDKFVQTKKMTVLQ